MRIAVPLFLVLLLGGVAHAQIVNVQGALAKAPTKNGVDGTITFNLGWSDGNAPSFNMAGSGTVVWKHDDFLTLAVVSGEYGTALHVVNTKKTFEHLRERVRVTDRWRWELFGQHEYDEFRRLSFRALLGTGPAFQILNKPDYGLLAGVAYMLDVERLDDRESATDSGRETTEHRFSAYVTGHEKVIQNVTFVQTMYAQPKIDDAANYRLLGEAALLVKLSKRYALTNGLVIGYDSRPPQQIRRFDSSLKVGLVVTL
ncbi:MAG TPA: DUF481 domain-containing protein [Kofleriaceae bacterium]